MNWLVNQLVKLLIDVLVKIILKWVADREAERAKNPSGKVEEPSKKEPVQVEQGWGDKSFRTGKGPGGIV